jgi:small GTP-binding protein
MGALLSVFSDWIYGNREASILILGLDASGKTTIMNRLKYGDNMVTVPTIGFNCEHIKFGSLSFIGWDIGGQNRIRKLWHNYYENADAVVFVIDSSDRARFPEVKEELTKLTEHTYLKDCAFLIFANKQDLPNAASTNELSLTLDIHPMMRKFDSWKVCESTATSGNGVDRGFGWLSSQV